MILRRLPVSASNSLQLLALCIINLAKAIGTNLLQGVSAHELDDSTFK